MSSASKVAGSWAKAQQPNLSSDRRRIMRLSPLHVTEQFFTHPFCTTPLYPPDRTIIRKGSISSATNHQRQDQDQNIRAQPRSHTNAGLPTTLDLIAVRLHHCSWFTLHTCDNEPPKRSGTAAAAALQDQDNHWGINHCLRRAQSKTDKQSAPGIPPPP